MFILAVFISLLLLSGYLYMVYAHSKELFSTILKLNNNTYCTLYFIGLVIPGIVMILLFNNERFVYYWDYSGYWLRAIHYTHGFFENPLAEMSHVYHSVRAEEYNVLPNLLLAPVNRLFGLDYRMYIFSNYLVYFLPFALIASNLIIKTSPYITFRLKLALPFFILFFTPCLIPIRFGFVDVVGLVFIAIILSIFINNNYLRDKNIKQSILLGILLLALIFSRRWYAFWFAAFFVSAFITNVLFAFKHKDKKAALNSTLNLGVAGVTAMAIMLVLFMPFFKMTVLKDYTDIYSAYRSVTIGHQVILLVLFFGGFIIVTAIAGMLVSIRKEKSLTVFIVLSTIIIILHFSRVNDFGGYQHFYLLMPFFLFFFCKALVYLDKNKFILPIFFGLLLINNYVVFAKNDGNCNNAYIFSAVNGKPNNRADYDALMALSNKTAQLLDEGNLVYCVASGSAPAGVLNDDILRNTRLPDINHSIFKLSITQHVDKRDHFPNELFLANYVIVTSPVQLHLGADNQKVVDYFNREILEGQMKSHYEKVQEFKLDGGVKAIIMKKIAGFSDAEIQVMKDYFKNAYPEYPEMYNVNNITAKITELVKGNGYGAINFLDGRNIEFIPGSERASRMTLQFGPNDKTLNFNAIFRDKESLAHNCNPEKDGEVYLTILENDVEVKKLYITHRQDVPVSIDVSGNKKITLIVDKGKNEDYCDWFELTDFIIK